MRVAVASGKGGTGKTTIVVNLVHAQVSARLQVLDCDVEEPNLHLFLKPDIYRTEEVRLFTPEIDESKCNLCGRCTEICSYNALALLGERPIVFSRLCHGCGGCQHFCPQGAISERKRRIGVVERGKVDGILFGRGILDPGEALAPPVIKHLKQYLDPGRETIIDASPGTSCPVVEALWGSDYVLLVTEPTPFGLNDLQLSVEMCRKLELPMGVVINRSDIGDGKIKDYLQQEGIPLLMEIPYRREFAECYAEGFSLVEKFSGWGDRFRDLWNRIRRRVKIEGVAGNQR